MENRLARKWLGLLFLAATFSKSTQKSSCQPSGPHLICFGFTDEDIVDLRDNLGILDRSSVQQISISRSQIGNFTNEVLLSFRSLREMTLMENNISPAFFPVGVFKNVAINRLSILMNNVEYNNHFAKVINDLKNLTELNLEGNRPIRNFDSAAIETFDRLDTLTFSPEYIVCDCDLSWFRNYLLNYEGDVQSKFSSITCNFGGVSFDVTDSNFCSTFDGMVLECRSCNEASSNEECNAMGNQKCPTTSTFGTHPLCLNEITYAGGEKLIRKSCASSSRCRGTRANNERNCYADNPTTCEYCCRGELCNDFETAVLENYFPANYPFRPTTPVPTTTLPTTTYKPTTSKFTTTPFMTSLVPTTQAPSTMATTSPTTTERTTIPTTSETTKVITTFPPTTETTTSPTTTIQTTIPATTPKFTTMEPTTTTVTTMQPTTTTVTTTQPTTTTFTTMQPTTTTITTMQPATTTQPTTTTITTMQPATTTQPTTTTITTMQPATTTQPTTTTITTMQPTSAVTTVQPTTTTVTTMPPTTTTITTMQPTTTTVTTMQPPTTTVTTMQPPTTTVTTMQPPTTTVTTMQPPTTTVTTMQPPTTMQPTTKTTSTMKAKTSKVITTQPLTTTASTTQPETTKLTTKEPKTTTNPLTTRRKSTASSTTQITTIIFTEEGNLTTPDLTTSLPNIIETTTAKITTISPTTMVYLCPPEEQNGKYGDLQWPGTKVGSVAIIECPFNLGGFTANATRMCVLRGQSAVWKDPDLSSCSSNSDVLEKLAHENVTTENIVEIAEELAEVTDESDTLEESDVENAVTVIESISKVVNDAKDDTKRVLEDIIETVNHLSQVQDEQLTKAQRAGNTSSRIIQAVESTIMSIEIQDSDYDSKSEALDVRIIKLNNEREAENIRFPKFDAKKEDDNEV
ncbi:Adhesion G protein-coupled receptor A2 [Holothuria leucospilota]|uniref:Adhesion G protein-coupled receptor A2 n=1 Tax=Holothuria leucospilota TaxID=206669 RepID=A0A9Q1BIT3_HOLLE|nr:Adhesion G protein-coupled receptor A2 [Holothuria leucospilota]